MNSTLRHKSKYKLKFNLDIFRKETLISCFSFCREELSIHVSIAAADVGQILTKPPVPVKEVVECFNTCKAAMERRGLKINNGKMKILVSKYEIL